VIETTLPNGRVQLVDCVFRKVGAVIAAWTVGALGIEASNCLHLGPDALMELDHFPAADEPLAVALADVTVRGGGPLIRFRCRPGDSAAGSISIRADRCALVMGRQSALFRFSASASPEPLLAALQWNGQGCLVPPQTSIVEWERSDGGCVALSDAAIPMAGLVRSEVQFAGPPEDGPDASRLVRWLAPLASPDPPGIDPRRLSWNGD
jgi:hypothetical protein